MYFKYQSKNIVFPQIKARNQILTTEMLEGF